MKHQWDKIWYSTDCGYQTYKMQECSNCHASRQIRKVKRVSKNKQYGIMGPYIIWNGLENCHELSQKEIDQAAARNKLQEEQHKTKLQYKTKYSLLNHYYYWVVYNNKTTIGRYYEDYGWMLMPEYEEQACYFRSIDECEPLKEVKQ